MKLKNLIDVAEKETTIMLSGIKADGTEVGFDFAHNCWLDNNLYSTDRLSTIGDFRLFRKYRVIKENRIEDFSIFKAGTVHEFRDATIYQGRILKIKIFLVTGKSEIHKAIEARVNNIASKRIKAKEAGRIKSELHKGNKKKKWSFEPKN